MGIKSFLQRPMVIKVGQLAVTGQWRHPAHRLLAENIEAGAHASVLDLGSGRSPVLHYLKTERYAGLDLHPPDLEYAKDHYAAPDFEFVEADVLADPLDRWHGFDVVTCSSLFHHFTDAQVEQFVDRIATQVEPKRWVFFDTVTRGPMRGLITRIDYGHPARSKEDLFALFRPRFDVKETWSYDNRFRTFHIFGFELEPRPA